MIDVRSKGAFRAGRRGGSVWASWALAALMGCGAGGGVVCIPGSTQTCVCPGARIGAQSCNAEGRGYEPCQCDVAPGDGGAPGLDGARPDGGAGIDVTIVIPPRDAAAGEAGTVSEGGVFTGDPTRGAEVYATYCAACHGPDGLGTRNGSDLSDEVPEHSNRELIDTIVNGKEEMPPQHLTEQELADVIAFLRARFGEEEDE